MQAKIKTYLFGFVFLAVGIVANFPYHFSVVEMSGTDPFFRISGELDSLGWKHDLVQGGVPLPYYIHTKVIPNKAFAHRPESENAKRLEDDYRSVWSAKNLESDPGFTQLSWVNLIGNLVLWTATLFGMISYERYVKSRLGEGQSRKLQLSDLLLAVSVIALVFGVWRVFESRGQQEQQIGDTIQLQGGRALYSTMVPSFAEKWIPKSIFSKLSRLRSVELNNPNDELVREVTSSGYITQLSIGGGKYDFKYLRSALSSPYLAELQVSGRTLTPEVIGWIAQGKQLFSLNLMRTNITNDGLSLMKDLPRLAILDLKHTDVQLSRIDEAPFRNTLRELRLPIPADPSSDQLKISSWPKLLAISIHEWDSLLNDRPLTLECRELPMLSAIRLDSFQLYDLDLSNLPELQSIQNTSFLGVERYQKGTEVSKSPRIRHLKVHSVPKLKDYSVFLNTLEHVEMKGTTEVYLDLDLHSFMTRKDQVDLYPAKKRDWAQLLPEIAAIENLAGVDLSQCDLTNADLTILTRCKKLKDIQAANATGIDSKQFEQFRQVDTLTNLYLPGIRIKGTSAERIVKYLPQVKYFYFEPLLLDRLRLERAENVEKLFVGRPFQYLYVDAFKIHHLPKLNDPINLVKPLKFLEIVDVPSLQHLTVYHRLPANAKISGVRDLESFAAGGKNLTDDMAKEVLQCKKLKSLTLAYPTVTRETLEQVATLTDLEYLSLPGCPVDDSLVESIAGLSKLKVLRLDETKITAASINSICKLEKLEQLGLSGTEAVHGPLNQLVALPKLTHLSLRGAKVDAALLSHIPALERLKVLDLSKSEIDAAAFRGWDGCRFVDLEQVLLRDASVDGRAMIKYAHEKGLHFDMENADIDPGVYQYLAGQNALLEPEVDLPLTARIVARLEYERQLLKQYKDISKFHLPQFDAKFKQGEIDIEVFAPPDSVVARSSKIARQYAMGLPIGAFP